MALALCTFGYKMESLFFICFSLHSNQAKAQCILCLQVRNRDGYLESIHRLCPTRLFRFFLVAFDVDRAVPQLRSSCFVGASYWPVSTVVDALMRSM